VLIGCTERAVPRKRVYGTRKTCSLPDLRLIMIRINGLRLSTMAICEAGTDRVARYWLDTD
jgi:hypothetical protein